MDEIYSSDRPMNGRGSVIMSANGSISTDSNGDGSAVFTFDKSWATNGDYSFNVELDEHCADHPRVEESDGGSYHSEITVHVRGCDVTSGSVKAFVTVFAERTD